MKKTAVQPIEIWTLNLAFSILAPDYDNFYPETGDKSPYPPHIRRIGRDFYNRMRQLRRLYAGMIDKELGNLEKVTNKLPRAYEIHALPAAIDLIAQYQENYEHKYFQFMKWADIIEVQDWHGFKNEDLEFAEAIWDEFVKESQNDIRG